MAIITVTSSADTLTPGTLRYSIANANPGDTIVFQAGITLITIGSSLNINVLTTSLTIQGPGSNILTINNNASITSGFFLNTAAGTIITGMTLLGDTNPSSAIFNSGTLIIDDLIITGHTSRGINNALLGKMTINNSIIELNDNTTSSGTAGAGINNVNATLIIQNNTIIRQNTAGSNGGGISNFNAGVVDISDSTISQNTAGGLGGGIYNSGSTVTINNSTIENNSIPSASIGGGGIFNDNASTLTISDSTISENISLGGASVYNRNTSTTTITHSSIWNNQGGGITNTVGSKLFLYNSTVNGNTTSANTGGFYNVNSTSTIKNSTITQNTTGTAALAGGVSSVGTGSVITIGNTIVANNTSGGPNKDVFTNQILGFSNQGYNLVENTTGVPAGTFSGATNDIIGTDPQLFPLGNYGGPTLSQLPMNGSPVIDAGSLANIPPDETTDQRGFPRISGASVDIGSVEVQAVICYRGDSNILTRNCLTGEISEIRACDMLSGVHEVFSINDNDFIPIKYNIVTGLVEQFRIIKMNSLGENKPNKDLYITGGHKIMLKGLEVKAANVPGAKRFKVKPEIVYSVCTEKRCPVLINNLAVMSWGYDEWHKFVETRNIDWKDNNIDIPKIKKVPTIQNSNI